LDNTLETLYYEFGNGTDIGCIREKNEDAFVLFKASDRRQVMRKGHLVLICDGMGGARGGREASSMAIDEIAEVYYSSRSDDPRTAITQAIKAANSSIYHRSQEDPALQGMGTTVVAVIIIENRAYIAHVGDSRCYFIRNREIEQVTEDHTLVQQFVRQGMITDEEARNHPDAHILSRSVGVAPEVEVGLTMEPFKLRNGDTLVLCSDGLSGQVMEDEILQIVVSNAPQRAVEKLISLAKERGGPDNITVQIIKTTSQEKDEEDIGTTTVRTAPLYKQIFNPFVFVLVILFILAGVTTALWYFDIIDFSFLTQQTPIE
jgi:protein phosphatase